MRGWHRKFEHDCPITMFIPHYWPALLSELRFNGSYLVGLMISVELVEPVSFHIQRLFQQLRSVF